MHPKVAEDSGLSGQKMKPRRGHVESSSVPSHLRARETDVLAGANAARYWLPWWRSIGALKHWFSLRAEWA
jgi:hypothetical protein